MGGVSIWNASKEGAWSPPNVDGELKTLLGGSVVDQFVAGHDATDVLRELVQNEFDAGGTRLDMTFGHDALTVSGNGRPIKSDGWRRLSVILGTGRVVGDESASPIAAKMNGIGSKNFGLRSLFILGDRIHVRSGGQVAVLDLPRLATARVRDPAGRSGTGVSIHVPYRSAPFQGLEPFTVESEARTLDAMAGGMLATLAKLAPIGARRGIENIRIRSERSGRQIQWVQRAETTRCKAVGVKAIRRTGRMTDTAPNRPRETARFEEIEFQRAVPLPSAYAQRDLPEYYRRAEGRIQIAVSLPITRQRVDRRQAGRFYYPLQTPHSWTGCCVSVSAPFDLDGDRSKLLGSDWNEWLAKEAAALACDLLASEWMERFGADAFAALRRGGATDPATFSATILRLLSAEALWPAADGFCAKAKDIVLPDDSNVDCFLERSKRIDPRLASDEVAKALAREAGAKPFILGSLVRLRCGGKDARLKTKLADDVATYFFTDHASKMKGPELQAKFAATLTRLSRKLSNPNRQDLRETPSTLAADGTLKPASELVLVDDAIWDACPEPLATRLHPILRVHTAIAKLCQEFDYDQWFRNAAARAINGTISDPEREALYGHLLERGDSLSRRAIAVARSSPIVRDQHGAWIAPDRLLALRGATGKLLYEVLSGPSLEVAARPQLLTRLRVRQTPNGDDLVFFASAVASRPELAERFERLLEANQRLLTPGTVKRLAGIRFLRTARGTIAAPEALHLDTAANRLCVGDEAAIVGGNGFALYRKLNVHQAPRLDTLLATVGRARESGQPPPAPDILYPALAAAMVRERSSRAKLEDQPLLWIWSGFRTPAEVLVGHAIPRILDGVVPVIRSPDAIVRAYEALGAATFPKDEHWRAFFVHFGDKLSDGEATLFPDRRLLLEAYHQRSHVGLPPGLDDARCLLDRRGMLRSLTDLKAGRYLEDDYPALAQALEDGTSTISFADARELSRAFLRRLGLRTLTSVCGGGAASFSFEIRPPLWFRPAHTERILAIMHRPDFARALYELAGSRDRSEASIRGTSLAEIETRLAAIGRIAFLDRITREYSVAGSAASVQDETAVGEDFIAVVRPRTELDLKQLVAQSLGEVAGVREVSRARSLASTILPLLLVSTDADMRAYLKRQGITVGDWGEGDDAPDDEISDRREDIFRHLIASIDTGRTPSAVKPEPSRTSGENSSAAAIPPAERPTPVQPQLPPLEAVVITVAERSGTTLENSLSGNGWSWRRELRLLDPANTGRR